MTEAQAAGTAQVLDIVAIQKAIPHRYPFLLVDRVEIVEPGKKVVGTKCVTINEEFFNGHFPGYPVMPGVLIIEALAQTACAAMLGQPGMENKLPFFMGIDKAKFRSPVRPGNVLTLKVEFLRLGSRAGRAKAEAFLEDGSMAAEAEISFVVGEKGK